MRVSLRALSAAVLLIGAVGMPVAAQSPVPSSPVASIPAGPTITVTATDYHFAGLPTTLPVGAVLGLVNEGKDVHEIALFRKNDGVTKTTQELLQMPPDEVGQYVTQIGGIFAAPGETATDTLAIAQTGEYVVLCFVPQGLTYVPDPSASPDPAWETAMPHFMLGMLQEFTATEAGTPVGPLPSEMPMASTAP